MYLRWAFVLAAPVLAVACYWTALEAGFCFDDTTAILRTEDIKPSTPLSDVFLHDFWGFPVDDPESHKSYRPLVVWSFRLNYARHGLDAFGYHLVNVVSHAVVTVAVMLLAWRLAAPLSSQRARLDCVWVSGWLFATHPVHTDAVVPAVGRAELFGGLCFVLALVFYCGRPGELQVWRVFFFFVCLLVGLLCKETAFTAFAVAFAFDYLTLVLVWWWKPRERPFLGALLQRVLERQFFCAMFIFTVLSARHRLTRESKPIIDKDYNYVAFHPVLQTRALSYPYFHARHFWLFIYPWVLSPDYSYVTFPLVESLFDPRNLLSLGFYALMLVAMPLGFAFAPLLPHWLQWRTEGSDGKPEKGQPVHPQQAQAEESAQLDAMWGQRRSLLMCVVIMIVPFLPATNYFFIVGFEVAERVMYMPSVGFCILLGFAYSGYMNSPHAPPMRKLCVTLLVFLTTAAFGYRTYTRNMVWESELVLWRETARILPTNAKAQYNYGNELLKRNVTAQGLEQFRKAEALFPGSYLNDVGVALYRDGRVDEAQAVFEKCIKWPIKNLDRAYRGLGACYVNKTGTLVAEYPQVLPAHREVALRKITHLGRRARRNFRLQYRWVMHRFFRAAVRQLDLRWVEVMGPTLEPVECADVAITARQEYIDKHGAGGKQSKRKHQKKRKKKKARKKKRKVQQKRATKADPRAKNRITAEDIDEDEETIERSQALRIAEKGDASRKENKLLEALAHYREAVDVWPGLHEVWLAGVEVYQHMIPDEKTADAATLLYVQATQWTLKAARLFPNDDTFQKAATRFHILGKAHHQGLRSGMEIACRHAGVDRFDRAVYNMLAVAARELGHSMAVVARRFGTILTKIEERDESIKGVEDEIRIIEQMLRDAGLEPDEDDNDRDLLLDSDEILFLDGTFPS